MGIGRSGVVSEEEDVAEGLWEGRCEARLGVGLLVVRGGD